MKIEQLKKSIKEEKELLQCQQNLSKYSHFQGPYEKLLQKTTELFRLRPQHTHLGVGCHLAAQYELLENLPDEKIRRPGKPLKSNQKLLIHYI